MATNRVGELDSLRGVAALSVFLLHLKLVFPTGNLLSNQFDFGILRPFIVGQEAVILFFVLSGFVLSIPYNEGRAPSYRDFFIRRICRIYIPYIVTVALSVACKQLFYHGNVPSLNAWVNSFWWQSVTPQTLMEHILMFKAYGSNLNPILWSLVFEMRISLLFPVLVFLLQGKSIRQSLVIAFLCSILGIALAFTFQSSPLALDYIYTIHYVAMFVIGITVAKNRAVILSWYSNISKLSSAILLTIIILFFIYTYAPYPFLVTNGDFSSFVFTVIKSWIVTVGAVALILAATNSKYFKQFLLTKPVSFLGQISYSLYLIHFVVFIACLQLLHDKIPLHLIVMLSLFAGILASTILYYTVERPAMMLGKALTKRKQKLVVPAQ